MAGRLLVGTSGFAYRDWAPRFYPPDVRQSAMLREYAARLPAVELNNTFYRQPRPAAVAGWLAQTPADFRFVVKAQRGGSLQAFGGDAAGTVEWLTAPYRLFGARLGAVLLRVPGNVRRDDGRLAALLAAWPSELPLAVELQDESWRDDAVLGLLREHGAALCATDLDDRPPPDLHLTSNFAYVRLRRTAYSAAELRDWAARLAPFLDDGRDCFVFFRHDADGESALSALALAEMLDDE